MENCISFIHRYRMLIDDHISSIKRLLSSEHIRNIGWEYNEAKNSQPERPFNVFTIVSDLYYRENFHSDIIKALLDPSENHKEGTDFLYTFIDFINNNYKKVCILKQDYTNARVEREPGRIDILISSKKSRHCIIIENKMYNAVDRPRQLPRYYDYAKSSGYSIDAIIYLPLDANKEPDQTTWTETDKKNVLPLLCVVPAYQKNGVSLVSGWIEPCAFKTRNLDCISVLRQYGELIKVLSNNKMDNVILTKFYQSLLDEKSLDTAISVRNMLNELPILMADRLRDIFAAGNNGEYTVWKWKPTHCGICFNRQDKQYKIDIWTSETGYCVYVFGQHQTDRLLEWAKGMKSLNSFIYTDDAYKYADFSFYDEDKVIECVRAIIAEMREILSEL